MNKKLILTALIFALILRLISISQSLWLDEAITSQVIKNYSFWEIIIKFSPSDFHPPLYYLFIKLWTSIFGYSELSLRFPSLLFSLATGYFLYKYVNLWSAVLFLFNPLIIYYSQEARMYMTTTFFLSLGLLRFLKYKKLDFISLISFSLALFTFYGSLFFITSLFLYLVFSKKLKEAKKLLLTTAVSLLILLPLIKTQLETSILLLSSVKNWSLVLGKANLKNLLLVPIKFSIGRISFYPKYFYYAIAFIWTVIVFSSFKNFNKNFQTKVSAFIFISTLFMIFLVSFYKPMLQYFRVIYLVVPLVILMSNSPKQMRIIFLTGFLMFSLIYLLIPKFHREDWKSLVKDLKGGERIYIIPQVKAPIEYYAERFRKNIEIKPLTEVLTSTKYESSSIIVLYAAEIFGINTSKLNLKPLKTYREIQIFTFSLSSNIQ